MHREIEAVALGACKPILRYPEKRGTVTFASGSGDGEVNAVLGPQSAKPDGNQNPVPARRRVDS